MTSPHYQRGMRKLKATLDLFSDDELYQTFTQVMETLNRFDNAPDVLRAIADEFEPDACGLAIAAFMGVIATENQVRERQRTA